MLALREQLVREHKAEMAQETQRIMALALDKAHQAHKKADDDTVIDESDTEFSSGLSVLNPAVDVLAELAGICPLDLKLIRMRNGFVTTGTVSEFFDTTITGSQSLVDIFEKRNHNSSILFSANRFANSLRSTRHATARVTSICTLLAVSKYCPELKHKIRDGIVMAASMVHQERLIQISTIKKNGQSIAVPTELTQRTLTQMPGIAEMNSSKWLQEQIISFKDLVLEYIGFDSDKANKLKIARQKLSTVSGKAEKDCEQYLSTEREAFDECTSWLGFEVENDFCRFERILSNSPEEVRKAYVTYVSSPDNEVTLESVMQMKYAESKDLFQKVWNMARSASTVGALLDLSANVSTHNKNSKSISWADVATQDHQGNNSSAQPAAIQGKELSDMILQCKVCSADFTFTVQQQEYHKSKGYQNMPNKCPEHRSLGMCDQFKNTGTCAYGDQCKFQHSQSSESTNSESTSTQGLLPGSIKRQCKYQDEGCYRGVNCPYQHKGLEIQQEDLAVQIEKDRKSSPTAPASSAVPPPTGRGGLSVPRF
jgi:hypothetical protein